ncbi:MAG: hypothetical protein M3463_10555 [Verrucomicrobiota bacterium]|nr:hypothetical protein [Verrucomicrobiota bacterium]
MKRALVTLLSVVPLVVAFGQRATIDISRLPPQSKMIDDVVVPVPSEIFGVLDKLGKPHWEEVLRAQKNTAKPPGEQAHTALLLGTVISEGFIAVEAENTEEVKKIGKSVLNLARALGVEKEVIKRTSSIIDFADKKQWSGVRRELDGALSDVKAAMIKLSSEPLSQLVSLGGWLRGTEALTTVVSKSYTREGAELLNQPVLLDYFDQRIGSMKAKLQHDPVVMKVQKGLVEIRPLIAVGSGADISEKTVQEIRVITEGLVKTITSKGN